MSAVNRRKLVVGNWKMNGSRASNAMLLSDLLRAGPVPCDVAVCPPYPFLSEVAVTLAGSPIAWGAQDCSAQEQGAFTGEVSAAMLVEFGCRFVIVGHSERRTLHGESDAVVAEKARIALARGLTPIVCVGETLSQREADQTEEVVKRQLSAVIHTLAHCAGEMVVAYEPVWAIGTGVVATPDTAQQAHAFLRAQVAARDPQRAARVRILYGGSVKADKIVGLLAMPDVDGALVGGASLDPVAFAALARARR